MNKALLIAGVGFCFLLKMLTRGQNLILITVLSNTGNGILKSVPFGSSARLETGQGLGCFQEQTLKAISATFCGFREEPFSLLVSAPTSGICDGHTNLLGVTR